MSEKNTTSAAPQAAVKNTAMKAVSPSQKKQFRTIGHQLNPIVTLGDSGLSANVKKELNRALEDHELIKVKVPAAERSEKKKLVESICQSGQCVLIQQVGNIALLYRSAKKPNPKLSNLLKNIG